MVILENLFVKKKRDQNQLKIKFMKIKCIVLPNMGKRGKKIVSQSSVLQTPTLPFDF